MPIGFGALDFPGSSFSLWDGGGFKTHVSLIRERFNI